MRFGFIAKYRSVWPLSWLCEALNVTRGGFHAWLKRPPSARAIEDARLSVAVTRSCSDSDRTYGARRVRQDLRHWGHRCGIHWVERLMRRDQLVARRRRRVRLLTVAPGSSTRLPPTSWSGSSPQLRRTANGFPI